MKRICFLNGPGLTFDALWGQLADEFLSLQYFGLAGLPANANEELSACGKEYL